MSVGARHKRRAGVVALAALLALPLLATAGPVSAAGRSGYSTAPAVKATRTVPVAAPSTNGLASLLDVLSRLFPVPGTTAAGLPATVASQVTGSTVRVTSLACGLRLQGSGFAAAPDTIVTNAHVVAGATTTQVLRPDGRSFSAQVVAFDPSRDLALLYVRGLGQSALGLGTAAVGESAFVFGHPGGQVPVAISPAQVTRRVTADIGDIYDQPTTPRQILVLNADIEPGDSGAPLVNSSGQVVGVAFAVANLRQSTAFAIASEEVVPVLAQPRNGPVSTGPCIV